MDSSHPRRDDYSVGWICALPIERAAAEQMLDEEYEDSNDGGSYTFGRIGSHYVVIASLPAGHTGLSSAAVTATLMRSAFPSIRFGLMVGIGGGVPGASADVRLGDVVISQPSGLYPGVVQYDFGKAEAGGRLMRTGALNAPPSILLDALTKLQTNHLRRKRHFLSHLSCFEGIPEFAYENAGPDTLFRPDYNHVGGPTCDQCSTDCVVTRSPRFGGRNMIHYGTIASGNQVIKDGLTRDRLSSELGGVLCFEMEAAGLMNHFPSLVVRGICDYADSHKNKRWQPYAAATAAACAKEFLLVLPKIQVANSPPVATILRSNSGTSAIVTTKPPYVTFYVPLSICFR
jgi:nucleoside phosphorylase